MPKYGSLDLEATMTFQEQWKDEGSGGDYNVGFWHPVAPEGYYPLGSIAVPDYSDPNDVMVALCVGGDSQKGAFAPPTGYKLVWTDTGSGAKENGSCWQPIPPAGYLALGYVFNKGYDEPSLEAVACVRVQFAAQCGVGGMIWIDKGTGVSGNLGVWRVVVPTAAEFLDPEHAYLDSGCFVARKSWEPPKTGEPNVWCLKLPWPGQPTLEPERELVGHRP